MKKLVPFALIPLFGLLVAFAGKQNDEPQPIAYNHNKHVEENGMECLDCHVYAEEHAYASIPNTDVCKDCHEEAVSDNPDEARLVEFIDANKQIPWRQINKVPDYAYFSHRRHVKLGQIECQECHGDVGKLKKPMTEPFVEIKMAWCLDCHEQRQVSNDCSACHR